MNEEPKSLILNICKGVLWYKVRLGVWFYLAALFKIKVVTQLFEGSRWCFKGQGGTFTLRVTLSISRWCFSKILAHFLANGGAF